MNGNCTTVECLNDSQCEEGKTCKNWVCVVSTCTPNLVNTSWSDWFNISCLANNKMNQSRTITRYDNNSCGTIANQTFTEYKADLTCSLPCTPNILNITSAWTNISCLSNDKMNQSMTIVQYDSNNCGIITNKTFVEYRTTLNCDYCTPNLVNITSGWTNISCFSSQMNQSRYLIQYDSNNCKEISNQTIYSYRLTGPIYKNTSWSNWINITCSLNKMNQSRFLIQYDLYKCASNTTIFEYKNTIDCDNCIPNCTNKQCGDDGCSGSCGTCVDGKTCSNGNCIEETNYAINSCRNITSPGEYNIIKNITNNLNQTCIEILNDNVIINGNGYTLQGLGYENAIHSSVKNNLTIKNINMINFYYGIDFYFTTNSSLNNINILDSKEEGMILAYSSYNNISNINFLSNKNSLFLDSNSNNNNFLNIYSFSSLTGIAVMRSLNNNFSNIFIESSQYGISDSTNSKYFNINYENNIGFAVFVPNNFINSSFKHNTNTFIIYKNSPSGISSKTYKKDNSILLNYSIYHINTTIPKNYSYSIKMYPIENYNVIRNSNNLLINFTPSKEGIYTISLNVTLDTNDNEVRNYIFLVGNTSSYSKRYYMHNDAPIHAQPTSTGFDVGSLYLYPAISEEERHCNRWVQYSLESITNPYCFIKDIIIGWYYKSSGNSFSNIEKYATFGSSGDFSKTLNSAYDYTFVTSNHTNINISYDYISEFYWLALKLQGVNISVISNSTKQSYADFTYLYSGPQIIYFSENPGSDIRKVRLLSSYFNDSDKKDSILQFEGVGNFTIVLNLTPDNYTILFDGISCLNNPNCRINYNSNGIVNLSLNIIKGEIHTLRVYNISEKINQKNMNLYSDKQAFLVSTLDWKEVLSLVPVSVWTEQSNITNNDCQKVYGGEENICAYPTLMYNIENNSYIYYNGNSNNLTFDSNYRQNISIYENKVVYSNNKTGNFDIYLYDLNTKKEYLMINSNNNESNPVIYGNNIIYENKLGGISSLYSYDIISNSTKVLINNGFNQTNPSIYGNNVVYQDNRNGNWDIYLYDLNTDTEIRLTNNISDQITPDIYENLIVWSDNRSGNFSIYMYNLSSSIEKNISSSNGNQSVPDIYGNRIAWADYSMAGRADIYYFNMTENKKYRLTSEYREDTNPKFYGNRLVWQDYRNGNFDVYLYDFKNPKEVQITTGSSHQISPVIWNDIIVWLDLSNNKNNLYYLNYTGWHEEYELSNDIDSIILFLQQYQPDSLKIINGTTNEITNVLVSEPNFGAGLSEEDISIVNPKDYFNYWSSYYDVVYCDNNYSLALTASVLASLLNAPLVIKNSSLDKDEYLINKNIICIGNVNRPCNKTYSNLTGLENHYMNLTNTNKIMLVNPTDLTKYVGINLPTKFYAEKTTWLIKKTFTQTSLSAPFLASAKHELIAQTAYTDYPKINNTMKSYYKRFGNETFDFLTVVAAPNAIAISSDSVTISGYSSLRTADPSYYADIGIEHKPDLGVGRIQGINPSDVSSLIARTLFYDKLNHRFNNITLMVGNGADDHNGAFRTLGFYAQLWAPFIRGQGYYVDCALRESSSNACYNYTNKHTQWPPLMPNKDYILQGAHGASNYGGIYYYQIPKMNSSLTMLESCSTCSTYSYDSYCNHVLRKGGIGIVSAISTEWAGSDFKEDFMNDIYYYNMSIGEAFSDAYEYYETYYWMYSLLGDPTFKLNPDYKFNSTLP
jgi:beta propeller repeat protein